MCLELPTSFLHLYSAVSVNTILIYYNSNMKYQATMMAAIAAALFSVSSAAGCKCVQNNVIIHDASLDCCGISGGSIVGGIGDDCQTNDIEYFMSCCKNKYKMRTQC